MSWTTHSLKARNERVPIIQTHCKICRGPILQGQPREWLTKPMGLSHTTCTERRAA